MDLEITFTGTFTRSQIRAIADAHPELGRELAAQAFLEGNAPRASTRTVRKSASRRNVPRDSAWRLVKGKKAPLETTHIGELSRELVKQFGDKAFYYQNMLDACHALGIPTSAASHLIYGGYVTQQGAKIEA